MTLDIEWTGKSYTNQIDDFEKAIDAANKAYDRVIETAPSGDIDDRLNEAAHIAAEKAFEEIAFKDWIEIPENWSLV